MSKITTPTTTPVADYCTLEDVLNSSWVCTDKKYASLTSPCLAILQSIAEMDGSWADDEAEILLDTITNLELSHILDSHTAFPLMMLLARSESLLGRGFERIDDIFGSAVAELIELGMDDSHPLIIEFDRRRQLNLLRSHLVMKIFTKLFVSLI